MIPLNPQSNQCHYSWRRGDGQWVRCIHPKGVNHGERHENGRSWVHVSAELTIPYHRWVA